MSARHRLILALALPLAWAALFAGAELLAQPTPPLALPAAAPLFDAGRAEAQAAQWRAQYPARLIGSGPSADFRQALHAELTGLGYQVETQPFSVTIASNLRIGVNVLARRGPAGGVLLLAAHYDTPAYGGRDNVAGVAALLELARGLAPTDLPVEFLFADSGEYGQAAGAQAFVSAVPSAEWPRAALVLEAPAGGTNAALRVDGIGYLSGAAPAALRAFTLQAARLTGGAAQDAVGIEEAAIRAAPFLMTEASILNGAGLPAVRLSGPADVRGLGQAAEHWVRGLAARPDLALNAAGEWRLDEARHLPNWAAGLVTALAGLPLLAALGLALWTERPRWPLLVPEFVAWGGAALPIVNGLVMLPILVRLGWLPDYARFPAAPGDPFLLQPADWAVLVALAAAGVSAWDIWRARGWGALADRLNVPTRRVTLLLLLTLLYAAVWAMNGLAAALLLAPAAWLWPWITPSRFPAGRVLNVFLAAGGLLPVLAVSVGVALTPGLGLAWWFLLAGATYGLFPLPAVLAAVAGAGLFIRFLQAGLRQP